MKYKIPEGLNCTHCTLQWYWSTGNTCIYDAGYFSYFSKMAQAGWQVSEWCHWVTSGSSCEGKCCGEASGKFAEEFWNCADIRVLVAGERLPTPAPGPMPQEPEEPEQPAPQTTVAPEENNCSEPVQPWGKCGGSGYFGATCCTAGHWCKPIDPIWYHQCVPGAPPAAAPPATAPPASSPPAMAPPATAPPHTA